MTLVFMELESSTDSYGRFKHAYEVFHIVKVLFKLMEHGYTVNTRKITYENGTRQ